MPLPGQGLGLDRLKDVLRGLHAAFPDIHWSVDEQIQEGEKVVTRFTWVGTQQGEFFGVPASGRPVSVWGMVTDNFEGGKIKDTRIIIDTLSLMAQIGAFPPPSHE